MNDRKVHFSVPIHKIEYLDKQWETASRLARDGSDWFRMALDRERFRNRIQRTSEILSKIFDLDYRQQIYHERFENFVLPEPETEVNISETPITIKSSTTATIKATAATSEKEGEKTVVKVADTLQLEDQSTSQIQRPQQQHQTKHNKRRRRKNRGKNNHRSH